MGISIKAGQLPPRVATGVFILNSGIQKLSAGEATAAHLHGFAAGTYPFLKKVKPENFLRALAVTEIALGAALLIPVVPAAIAGAGLTTFSGGLLGLYARTPGMRMDGSVLPTQEGTALAKDIWLVGVGLGLIVDDLAG